MNIALSDLAPLTTEIFLLGAACTILVIDVFIRDERRVVSYALSQATLLITALIAWSMLDNEAAVVLHGTFVHDPMAALLKASIAVIKADSKR